MMRMSRRNILISIFLTNSMLLGFAYGLIGEHVRPIQSGDYDFIVSISRIPPNETYLYYKLHFCTGSLISHKSVLTAAHCLVHRKPNETHIIAGSTNLRKGHIYDIDSWITFDQWNKLQKTQFPLNDIAVITLKDQGAIRLHPVPVLTVDSEYLEDKDVRLCGWGTSDSGRQPIALRSAQLKVVSNEECSLHGTMLKGKTFTVPPNYFCSQAKPFVVSTCGDGGAPILNRKRRLLGINIGACPKVEGYPKEMLNELLMNSHLHLFYYKDFLNHVIL